MPPVVSSRENGCDTLLSHNYLTQILIHPFTRQALHWGEAQWQDRFHIRVPLHRLWYLCEEVRSRDLNEGEYTLNCLQSHRCPFEAIAIINLPTNLESEVTHRYTANAFKLHRLPTPRPGQVLGLVGTNGIGKSTALKILAGKLKPNLGRYDVRFPSVSNQHSLRCFIPVNRTLLTGKKFSNISEALSFRTTSLKS